jgi:hypothetical protein
MDHESLHSCFDGREGSTDSFLIVNKPMMLMMDAAGVGSVGSKPDRHCREQSLTHSLTPHFREGITSSQ